MTRVLKKSVIVAVGAVAGAMLTGWSGPALGEGAVPESEVIAVSDALPTPSLGILAESERLRGLHGFDPNLDPVLETFGLTVEASEKELAAKVNNWGFIGTADENREMQRRETLLRSIELKIPGLSSSEGFGGVYLDNPNNGQLVIQFKEAIPDGIVDRVVDVARTSGSESGDVRFEMVPFSAEDLDKTVHAVFDRGEVEQSERSMAAVQSVSVDASANGLNVGLLPGTDPASIVDLLETQGVPYEITYGVFEEEDCNNRNNCGTPRRAGVQINHAGGSCTSGYLTEKQGTPGGLTAGHCWYGDNNGNVSAGGENYGDLNGNNDLSDGTHADWRRIVLPSGSPRLYRNDNNKFEPVDGGPSLGAQGASICLFGMNSDGPRCGTIESTNANHTSNTCGCRVYGQLAANYASDNGDSGGAVGTNATGNVARSIHAGAYNGEKHSSYLGYLGTYNLGHLYIYNP